MIQFNVYSTSVIKLMERGRGGLSTKRCGGGRGKVETELSTPLGSGDVGTDFPRLCLIRLR